MRRELWAVPIVAVVVALLAIGLTHRAGQASSPLLDKPAPAFSLVSLDGKRISLASLHGHPVVVNFWASWCLSCKDEHPYLLAAWRRFAPRGVRFVGIAFNDSAADSRAFLAQHGSAWPSLQDPDDAIAVAYGVTAVPETVVIDSHGVVRLKSAGPITPAGPVTPAILNNQLTKMVGVPA